MVRSRLHSSVILMRGAIIVYFLSFLSFSVQHKACMVFVIIDTLPFINTMKLENTISKVDVLKANCGFIWRYFVDITS